MEFVQAASDAEILECFGPMAQLRDLSGPEEFLRRVRAQESAGYRLVAVRNRGATLAVAGFRVGECLAWGRHLYVDDLVTDADARSKGYGSALLDWLKQHARSQGANHIHLDSGHARVDAHRFYEREGLESAGIHFVGNV